MVFLKGVLFQLTHSFLVTLTHGCIPSVKDLLCRLHFLFQIVPGLQGRVPLTQEAAVSISVLLCRIDEQVHFVGCHLMYPLFLAFHHVGREGERVEPARLLVPIPISWVDYPSVKGTNSLGVQVSYCLTLDVAAELCYVSVTAPVFRLQADLLRMYGVAPPRVQQGT